MQRTTLQPSRRTIVLLSLLVSVASPSSALPFGSQNVSTSRRSWAWEGCPKGYTYARGGYIDGAGDINGKGGGRVVSNQDDCANMCDTERSCLSFEFNLDERTCEMNTEREAAKYRTIWGSDDLVINFCKKQEEWVHCADEGGSCQCLGEMRYGISNILKGGNAGETRYFYMDTKGEETSCSNEAFQGDPAPGWEGKKCYCRREVWEEFEECASEGFDNWCTCRGTLRYGADGKYNLFEYSGGGRCTNDNFGPDPIKGKKKACSCRKEWHHCAEEGQTCRCEGNVRYGANGEYTYKEFDGTVYCNSETFGDDPISGARKSCDCDSYHTPEYTAPYEECAEDGGVCACKGRVMYGSDDDFVYKDVNGEVSCTEAEFGDPGTWRGAHRRCFCYEYPEPLSCKWKHNPHIGTILGGYYCECNGERVGNYEDFDWCPIEELYYRNRL